MLRWLRTLPDHSYTDERMEEIHSKAGEDSAKQSEPSTETNATAHTHNTSSGGSSDAKQTIEGGESNKNEQENVIAE